MEFATRTIHAGQPSEPATGALIAPIFQTSTFEQEAPGVHRGFDYSRTNNPTRARLEAVLADLEGVGHAAVFASGLAAENAVLQAWLKPGDEIVIPMTFTAARTGCSTRCTSRPVASCGRSTSRTAARLEAALSQRTRLVWIESPTNPRLLVYDIADDLRDRPCARRARRRRQHVRDAVLPAAVRARRRHRRSQRDEVSRRPLGRDPGRGARARRRGVRADQVSAECNRRGAVAVRLLAHAARAEDARAADAASRGERRRDRRCARRASAGPARLVPGASEPSRPRHRPAADDRVRRVWSRSSWMAPWTRWCRSSRLAGSSRLARVSAE